MQKRKLGKAIWSFGSRTGLHGNELWLRPAGDSRKMISVIRAAMETRRHLLRYGEVYGRSRNEELVGEALAPYVSKW